MFDLKDKIVVITGGAGLLGRQHAEAVAEIGAIPVLLDVNEENARSALKAIEESYDVKGEFFKCDISSKANVDKVVEGVLSRYEKIDCLINNAARNPSMDGQDSIEKQRFESFSLEDWQQDISIGLTGALVCSQSVGKVFLKQKKGIVVNIASDLGIIAPDQRIYRKEGLDDDQQPVKPVTYSVVKHGLIGLTKYLATYWATEGIRVNALCPGGVFNDQPQELVSKIENLIPLGRMARVSEYKGAIQFLCSEASSYMTGQSLVVDGGRTCW